MFSVRGFQQLYLTSWEWRCSLVFESIDQPVGADRLEKQGGGEESLGF